METQGEAEGFPWSEEVAPAPLARRHLEELELRGDVLDYLTATPQRCYWAVQWATWFPAVKHRVKAARGFIVRRVEGACAGMAEDRTPPKEWWDLQERVERERRRREKELAQARAAARGPLPVPASQLGCSQPQREAPPLPPEIASRWELFLEVQAEHTRETWLTGAFPVRWREDEITVRAMSRFAADWLNRKQHRLMERVRERDAAFPEVWFMGSDDPVLRSDGDGVSGCSDGVSVGADGVRVPEQELAQA